MKKKIIFFLLFLLTIIGGKSIVSAFEYKDFEDWPSTPDRPSNSSSSSSSNSTTTSVSTSEIITSTSNTGTENECTTIEGYTDVITDLKKLGITNYENYKSSTAYNFITFNEIKNSSGKIETFIYGNFPRTLSEYGDLFSGSYGYEEIQAITISTEKPEVDGEEGFCFDYTLKLISKENDSYISKYKVNSLYPEEENRRYYLDRIKGPGPNEVVIDKVYWFRDNYTGFDNYTDVLDDLKNTDNFNQNDYPAVKNDYSLDIITVAESEDKELFIYVYNPSKGYKGYTATSINMSIDDEKFKKYYLKLVSSNGVFEKYVVENFEIQNTQYRIYNITSIFRLFDELVDEDTTGELSNTSEKAFAVAKKWTIGLLNGHINCKMEYQDYVDLKPIITSFIWYDKGTFFLYEEACAGHFIGFNVENYVIDKIFDADVEFTMQGFVTISDIFSEKTYEGDPIHKEITLSENDVVEYTGGLNKKYSWSRITTANQFLKQVEDNDGTLTDYATRDIEACQYVFNFYESQLIMTGSSLLTAEQIYSEKVTDVKLMRLHFWAEGQEYNLGVVGDSTESTGDAAGETETAEDLFVKILSFIAGLVLLCVALNFIEPLKNLFSPIFKALGDIIAYPFKLISKLFNRRE